MTTDSGGTEAPTERSSTSDVSGPARTNGVESPASEGSSPLRSSARKSTAADGPLLEAVCALLSELVPPEDAELAFSFCRLFLAKAPDEFFLNRAPEAIARLVHGSWRHLQRSRPDRVDVEVVNPVHAEEGWSAPVTVLRTHVSERPFVVDTIREYLHAEDFAIGRFLHPVLRVVRDESGSILEIGPAAEEGSLESLVYCEIPRIEDVERLASIRASIEDNLRAVVRATADFEAMLAALDDTVSYLRGHAAARPGSEKEIAEIVAFLEWLRAGAFVFLGYREYDISDLPDGDREIRAHIGSGLGILRDEAESTFARPVRLSALSPEFRGRVAGGPLLITSKTNAESPVHRRSRMDYIGIKKLDSEGLVCGEHRFIGLFTSQAYSEDAEQIPILREKLHEILADAGAVRGSHDWKEIHTIFNSLPKEELFLTSAAEIGREIQAVLALYHTHEVRVTVRPDALRRGATVMVILPKEKFSGEVRKEVERAFVGRFQGEVLNYHLALGGGDQARLHFYISATPEAIDAVAAADLEAIVRGLIRSWKDKLYEGLAEVRSAAVAKELTDRYSEAFSPEYKASSAPSIAEQDILLLEEMRERGETVGIHLDNPPAETQADGEEEPIGELVTRLKLVLRQRRLVLSDFMPILENAGLRVIAMTPFEVADPEGGHANIYEFSVTDGSDQPIDLVEHGGLLSETVLAVWNGDATNDALNALALNAGIHWRLVDVLRAYSEYAFQIGAVPSRISIVNALGGQPDVAALLIELFWTRFDPAAGADLDERRREASRLMRRFAAALDEVTSLGDDRSLRRLAVLINATLRTNFYRHGGTDPTAKSGGAPYVSLKFSGKQLGDIANRTMPFEVWVHSARMSGVHLRGAAVARGGIRWSDRPDDFRTEVMDLVRTQQVKNAVIVPAGSKGGFVPRRPPADPAAAAEEGREQYKTLVRGLLDLTDNLAHGEIVPPEGVVCWDDPDPYLVVAADKGTARFSDVANDVAAEYDYWLGDAFASGGSHGYDHKLVGITARGAWECVRRHFREMGIDIQTESFTVVGIGDMSGDVFGNGMLLSPQIRLIAAFDHRHVFVDPDPDPATSFAERQRLADLGRSSWADYAPARISEGGFIAPRASKEVELPPRARAALGLPDEVETLDGEALVRAVLAAPADLLWSGGIGTYVKASSETHSEVGDPSNDPVRIDADRVRARVVGEGGNLGLTQRARIDAALRGVRLNTDALDNSGGVDMSDREVNLKILLGQAIRSGRLDMPARNILLERLTPEVTELVIGDNRSQSLAVSLDERRALASLDDFASLMTGLGRAGVLDRAAERLPGPEALDERRAENKTLTRPELAVLLAYAKLALKRHLLASGLPDDRIAAGYLEGYFPPEAIEVAGTEALINHRLRREIVASQIANDLVDLMGATFIHQTSRDTGVRPIQTARAWVIASQLCGAPALRRTLSDLEGEIPADVLYRWLAGLGRVLERTSRWVLANVAEDAPPSMVVDEHLEGLALLRDNFAETVAGEEKRIYEQRVTELQALTERHDLARRLITLRFLDQLLEILRVARERDADPLRTARAYYLTSELLEIPWLREKLRDSAGENRWDQRIAHGLVDDLSRVHRALTGEVVSGASPEPGKGTTEASLVRVREKHSRELDAFHQVLSEIREEGEVGMSSLAVLIRGVSPLTDRR
ncbi:MAG TPA: NAD-glutamate dehydrogenase domain-containing protein [Longimicrobiales bacterium]|nr:NAD-glutamate dehydrogenase domain-containing protein [Longimicrobiales bacterium]